MLPTEKATIIYKFEETNKLIFSNHPNQHELATPQHLYFTSNEEIKEGDWCYHPELSQEYSIVTKEGIKTGLHPTQGVFRWKSTTNPWYKKAKKIIATTDKSLGLPEPSKRFLEVYVDAYNEGKKIEEVLVEMEDFGEEDWAGDDYTGEPIWRHDWRVKVKSDNTITIKKVKDSWNREEVIELLNKLVYDIAGNSYILDVNLKVKEWWLEQNL